MPVFHDISVAISPLCAIFLSGELIVDLDCTLSEGVSVRQRGVFLRHAACGELASEEEVVTLTM